MDTIYVWLEYVFLFAILLSILAALKKIAGKSKKTFRSALLLFSWMIVGAGLWVVVAGHLRNGHWIWERESEYRPESGVALDSSKKMNPPESGIFVNNEYGFSIVFPDGWLINPTVPGDSIKVKAVHRDSVTDNFSELNIDVKENEWGGRFAEMTAKDICKAVYGDTAELLGYGEEKIDGHKALWQTLVIFKQDVPTYAIHYTLVDGDYVYDLCGNTMHGGYEWYKENEDLLKTAIRSFKFLEK